MPELISDSFANNTNQWPLGVDDSSGAKINFNFGQNRYLVSAHSKNNFTYPILPTNAPVRNFYLSMVGGIPSGAKTSAVGVVFRQVDAENYYLFVVENPSYFALYVRYNGDWVDLINWYYSGWISSGDMNRITVIGKEDQFIFLINNHIVGSTSQTWLDRGKTGLVIEMYNPNENCDFAFTSFELRSPDNTAPAK